MINKIKSFFIDVLLITIFLFIFIYSNTVKINVLYGINLWINVLLPTLLPSLIISKLLIYYKIFDLLNNIIGKPIEKIFNVSKNASYVVITSIFTGFPTGSIYIKDLLTNNIISDDEANKLITFTSYSNPSFIIIGIGETLLHNKNIGILIFVSHLLSGLLIGIIFRGKKETNYSKSNTIVNNKSFIEILIKSINDTFIVLVNMLGIIIFFLIIISILNIFMPNNIYVLILKCLIEITSGINYLSLTNIPLSLKAALIGLILSFNGLSVHFQIKSIINETKIRYSRFLFARILHSILCFIFIYIFSH